MTAQQAKKEEKKYTAMQIFQTIALGVCTPMIMYIFGSFVEFKQFVAEARIQISNQDKAIAELRITVGLTDIRSQKTEDRSQRNEKNIDYLFGTLPKAIKVQRK